MSPHHIGRVLFRVQGAAVAMVLVLLEWSARHSFRGRRCVS